MLSNMSRLIAPSMLGMSVGTLVGKLATTTFGQYDLPLPREPHGRLVLVVSNVDHFADEWSIPRDDMVMWALTHEMVNHAVFSVEPIRARLRSLVEQFAGGFRADANSVAEGFTRLDVSSGDPMKILDSLLSDPTVLLGAARSSQQERLAPVLDAAMAAVVGFVDHQVDAVTARLLGGSTQIAEAVRRRRVAQTADRVFVERLLGVDLTTERVALGKRFIDGVVERAGEPGAQRLLASAESLPTPAELAAPGLWLARLETL
jgi:putative hydrolase